MSSDSDRRTRRVRRDIKRRESDVRTRVLSDVLPDVVASIPALSGAVAGCLSSPPWVVACLGTIALFLRARRSAASHDAARTDQADLTTTAERVEAASAEAAGATAGVALAEAAIRGLAATLSEVERVVEHLAAETSIDLTERLSDPDVVFVLASARDHYAVLALDSRRTRFARIVARRVVEPDASFDRTLTFARAALELPDVAAALLGDMVRKYHEERGPIYGAPGQGPPEAREVPGALRLDSVIRSQRHSPGGVLTATWHGARQLEAHGLAFSIPYQDTLGTPSYSSSDLGVVRLSAPAYAPTPLGIAFVEWIRGVDGVAENNHNRKT